MVLRHLPAGACTETSAGVISFIQLGNLHGKISLVGLEESCLHIDSDACCYSEWVHYYINSDHKCTHGINFLVVSA